MRASEDGPGSAEPARAGRARARSGRHAPYQAACDWQRLNLSFRSTYGVDTALSDRLRQRTDLRPAAQAERVRAHARGQAQRDPGSEIGGAGHHRPPRSLARPHQNRGRRLPERDRRRAHSGRRGTRLAPGHPQVRGRELPAGPPEVRRQRHRQHGGERHAGGEALARFNESLAKALELHRQYWTATAERANDPGGFIAWRVLAIACLAQDAGVDITVESGYLPKNLLDGTWVSEKQL
ncbi:immunity 49 family protein [Lentzea albidocapillata]|uniref:immunity 49 family protein n=1 Tax=Lentzea albidocapillata TaxID=40571 RepID=UPI000B7CFD18